MRLLSARPLRRLPSTPHGQAAQPTGPTPLIPRCRSLMHTITGSTLTLTSSRPSDQACLHQSYLLTPFPSVFLTPRNGLGVVARSLSLVGERAARVRNFVRQSSAKANETPREELFLPITVKHLGRCGISRYQSLIGFVCLPTARQGVGSRRASRLCEEDRAGVKVGCMSSGNLAQMLQHVEEAVIESQDQHCSPSAAAVAHDTLAGVKAQPSTLPPALPLPLTPLQLPSTGPQLGAQLAAQLAAQLGSQLCSQPPDVPEHQFQAWPDWLPPPVLPAAAAAAAKNDRCPTVDQCPSFSSERSDETKMPLTMVLDHCLDALQAKYIDR